ncbi:MAG: putative 2-dehydropantoate 2-reductase [Acidimicrobiales bacterium]|jgi:2-dehydropantoate 2-reductase|nr:putative 2-dehydropantoate 2-reductase [Acidimicrobiales bacterium]
MPEPRRRYAVVGVGAVGGWYGARLAHAGHEVHFVARSDAAHLRRHGLRVESPEGTFSLPAPTVWTSTSEVPPVDVVVLATKALDNAAMAGTLAPLLRAGTTLLVLQNGLDVEAPLAEAFPDTRVLGGMCFLCSNKVGPGHVRHLDYGRVTIGEYTTRPGGAGETDAVLAVVSDFAAAGVPAQPVGDLAWGRWRKLVWNVPYNGLSVVLDAGTDELMAHPATRALVAGLMDEVITGAQACGHHIEASFADTMLADTDAMRPYATSMKLDFDAGRPLELDGIYRAPLVDSRAAGVDLPRVAMLYAQLQLLDARNRRAGVGPVQGA